LCKHTPPPKPANSDARHYGDTENPENGVYHICGWQATGHENENNAGYKANAVAMVMKGLTPVILACGALFELADKANYDRYKSLYYSAEFNNQVLGKYFLVMIQHKDGRRSYGFKNGDFKITTSGDRVYVTKGGSGPRLILCFLVPYYLFNA
jgi:hypothetical protein